MQIQIKETNGTSSTLYFKSSNKQIQITSPGKLGVVVIDFNEPNEDLERELSSTSSRKVGRRLFKRMKHGIKVFRKKDN